MLVTDTQNLLAHLRMDTTGCFDMKACDYHLIKNQNCHILHPPHPPQIRLLRKPNTINFQNNAQVQINAWFK